MENGDVADAQPSDLSLLMYKLLAQGGPSPPY